MLDPTRVGGPQSILVGLDVPRLEADACFNHLLTLPPVSRVSLNAGRFNILAVAVFPDPQDLGNFVASELKALPKVRSCEVFPVYQTRDQSDDTLGIRTLDALDRLLVSILERDCRVSSAVLARKTGVSLNTVQRRLAALMMGQFMRILTVVDEGIPGWTRHAGFGVRVRHPHAHKIMEELRGFPEVKYLYYTTGRYDILGSVVCPGEQEVYRVVEEKIGGLEDVDCAEVFLPLRTAHNNHWMSQDRT
jgi:DNA-binding Lrp family transcriptional regulator